MSRYVWALPIEQDNLWIKWVHFVYIKDEDWWYYRPPLGCSWYWNQVSLVKQETKTKSTFQNLTGMSKFSLKHIYNKLANYGSPVYRDKFI